MYYVNHCEELLELECDYLVPAAVEEVITVDNADRIRASAVLEAANHPTTPAADAILTERDVPILPDLLTNAGGVTVSYFEWAQNIQQFRWELDRVRTELAKTMNTAYAAVLKTAAEHKIDLRTAAFVLAIHRVGEATLARRYVNENPTI